MKFKKICFSTELSELYGRDGYKSHIEATKEQRDLLFQKMKEDGYEWDADNKELKKIEQTSAWSEEDEKNLKKAVWYIENPASNVVKDIMLSEWLKSLKERI